MAHLLVFSGSLRKDSFNQRLATLAAEAAKAQGATVKLVSLGEYELPLFSEDTEKANFPQGAVRLKQDMNEAAGFLIASPEYNGFFTPALKNAIDWASRPYADEAALGCFRGKTAGLMAASPGGLGGLRGLPRLATLLSGIGTIIAPTMTTVPAAHEALAEPTEELLGKINATVSQTLALIK